LQVAKSKIRSANCGTKTNHAKGVKKSPKKHCEAEQNLFLRMQETKKQKAQIPQMRNKKTFCLWRKKA